MSIINVFKRLKLRTRINILMLLFILAIISLMVVVYNFQVKDIIEKTHRDMVNEQGDIIATLGIVEKMTGDGFNKKDYDLLKPYFADKKLFDTGYPFLVQKNGEYIIHPKKEGQNQLNSEYHQRRLSFKNGEGRFRYVFRGDDSGRYKWQYFKYFESYDAFLTVSFFEDELFKELAKSRNRVIRGLIILIVILLASIQLAFNPIIKSIKHIVENIGEMSKGKLIAKISYARTDEIGDIINSINKVIAGNTNTAKFAGKIGKGDYNTDYKPLSNEHVLGLALLEMRDNLKQAKEEEIKRNLEIEKQNWASQGLAKFADILRNNNNNIELLAFKTISNLTDYVNASVGAIYIVNDDNVEDVFFELISAVAYKRQKVINKKIKVGEELVGRAVFEKLTIHLTEIPDNYINITSGLGGANPSSLILVPMLIEDQVFGVIELASLNCFEPNQIEFIEKLGENIASTLLSVKNNQKTAKLLEESQLQKEQLATQEEEMRQNLEELMATQEEMKRRLSNNEEEEV